jgi:hypothetical protein
VRISGFPQKPVALIVLQQAFFQGKWFAGSGEISW